MDKKLEARIKHLEKILSRKNEDFDEDLDDFGDAWLPDGDDSDTLTNALKTAWRYAKKIAADARANCPYDDKVKTWNRIETLVENAYNYYDDAEAFNERRRALKQVL